MLSAAICDDEGLFCEKLAGELEGVLKKLGEPCRIRTYAGAEPLWQSGLDFDLLLYLHLP